MFDTGAMCAVSSQLFQELQLSIKGKMPITDSQRNKKEEIITLLPELKLGTIKFKNIECCDSFGKNGGVNVAC